MNHLNCCKGIASDFHCDVCLRAKFHISSFTASDSIALACFDLIHMDLWGPYRMTDLNGAPYFLTLVDDRSRATWVFMTHQKSQICDILRWFILMINTQFDRKIKQFRSDKGSEFVNAACQRLFTEFGILH